MDLVEQTIQSEEIYAGRIIRVRRDSVRLPNGREALREVVEHPGAVGILPLLEDGRVLLVRQFRYPFGDVMLEIPAGKQETGGEPPVACALRELEEETGYRAGSLLPMGTLRLAPGCLNERLHLFLARDLVKSEQHLDADEFLQVEAFDFDELHARALSGDLCDAKTVIALLRAAPLLP